MTGRRWWQCHNGHRNPISADAPRIFRARCDRCLDPGDNIYRIERDTPAQETTP